MILVVEDNLMNQKLALQVLKRLGCSAQVAANGQQALDLLQSNDFDLVLMDIQMPVMDGYTTTRHIRTDLQSTVPIIAMTAHALASEREQCLQAGMNDFLPKPFQVNELERILRKYAHTVSPEMVLTKPEATLFEPLSSFSIENLLTAVDNDVVLATELVDLFLYQTPVEINQLKQALAGHDWVTISQIIHSQKVPIQLFGLAEATQLLLELEAQLADKKNEAYIASLLSQYVLRLETEMPVIQRALSSNFSGEITQ